MLWGVRAESYKRKRLNSDQGRGPYEFMSALQPNNWQK